MQDSKLVEKKGIIPKYDGKYGRGESFFFGF